MSDIYDRIYKRVKEIPYGKVASYGQVAMAVGMPRGARLVGWALRLLPSPDIPWQRVINRERRLSIDNPVVTKDDQKRLLEQEGRRVVERAGEYFVEGDDWYTFS